MPRDWITFWAGHQGDIEAVYTLHKGLPDGLIEEMREAYEKAEGYLSTVSLKQQGRDVIEVDVSSETYSLTIPAPKAKLADIDKREKLRAFVREVVINDPLIRAGLREIVRSFE